MDFSNFTFTSFHCTEHVVNTLLWARRAFGNCTVNEVRRQHGLPPIELGHFKYFSQIVSEEMRNWTPDGEAH